MTALASERNRQGFPGDDGRGSSSTTSSLIDDTSTFLHPHDIIPFLTACRTMGAPLGLHLNLGKTKLLTTTTGVSVRDQPQTPHTAALIAALDYIRREAWLPNPA